MLKPASFNRRTSTRAARRIALSLGLMLPVTLLTTALSSHHTGSASLLNSVVSIGTPAQAQSADATSPDWASVEQNLVVEHNRVRQNPQSYIPTLEAYLRTMDSQGNIPNGCGQNCTLLTQEGRPAVEEAIAFLRNQSAVGPVTLSSGATQAAQSHARDQSDGTIGHTGSDGSGPSQRLERFGVENFGSGENIAYGPQTAQSVLMSLIIDDGVSDRGHRTNIFSPNWNQIGVGCGAHATIRTVCVMNYIKAPRQTAGGPPAALGSGSASSAETAQPESDTQPVSQFRVINNGTVELLSLKVANTDILNGPLSPGQTREITLNRNQTCNTTLTIQLGGRYRPLDWAGLNICDAAMTIEPQNSLTLRY
ncbi:MAG: CAP domain-containing protein [Cyanobacteria bacterium J06598_3]